MIADMIETLRKHPQTDLRVQHHFSDGIYAKQMHLPAGHMAVSHKHTYSHISILATGVARVTTDDSETIYHAPACIDIQAGVNHAIYAIEDVTWYCIHATSETDPEAIDEVLIAKED